MTFLDLVQQLADETDAASQPETTEGSLGKEARDLVRWTKQAWRDIQMRHGGRWRWLQRKWTLETVASTSVYEYGDATDDDAATAIVRFGSWFLNDEDAPPKIYLDSAGAAAQRWLIYVPWEYFQQIYQIGTQNEGAPIHITVDPQDRIVLGPTPDDVYVIQGDFFRSAQVLALDDDEPEIAEDFHDIIVYHALEKYGYQQVSQEALARAAKEGRRMLRQLEARQLPPFRTAGPLA